MFEIAPIQNHAHHDSWALLWNDYFPGMKAEHTHHLWQRLNTSDSPVKGIFLLCNKHPIGFAHYVLRQTTSGPKPECYLQDLYIAAASRNQGAGHYILNWFKEQATINGWSKVDLKTRSENTGAQKLYNQVCQGQSPYVHYNLINIGQ